MNSKIIIIGVGFAGLCAAIKLKQAGIHDFIILEKASEVGGTWRENTYPGAECDIPTALYSYSFEQNPDWDYRWAAQEQILEYIKHAASKHDVYSHIRFDQRVEKASYQQQDQQWQLQTASGDHYQCQFFISAVGQLHHPQQPNIRGADTFSGASFHSAKWDHDIDLKGKRVAVVGTGASAIQFVPPVVNDAAEVHVFQRSPNWILPKFDHPYKDWHKDLRTKFPIIGKLDRLRTWLRGELFLLPTMSGNRVNQAILKKLCLYVLGREITDDAKRAKLTPDYVIGAKRILFSDDYYSALNQSHVHLHTESLEQIDGNSLRFDGKNIDNIDVIIYGTGFVTNPFLSDMSIVGRDQQDLHDSWSDGAKAYLGLCCAGFPNFFMMYGPNTNLGHNSIVLMIEAQADYIVRSIKAVDDSNAKSIEVKAEVEQAYNEKLQSALSKTVWSQVDSWYTDRGRITNNWHGSTSKYRRKTRNFKLSDYSLN